ncbi:MAG: hypothetical protein NVSMB60_01080 [Mycobacterium sp.]
MVYRAKLVAATIGGAAAVGLVTLGVANDGPAAVPTVHAGSGASATGTLYVQPSVPAMTLTPAMSLGSTQTAQTTPSAASATQAAPAVAASAPATCSNNGVVLPVGCH